jgi:16S rRNA (uracil1498-N3)-methyltransferase
MPATPAWPPLSAPRLFVDSDLSARNTLTIEGAQAHYLINVMRMKAGDAIKLFDDISGEYAARVVATGRRDLSLAVEARLRDREPVPDLWLCAAPIKRARFDSMAEKACELGIARFVPVATARAVVDKVKPERLRARMIEAAEQCERTALPTIGALTKLDALLADWPEGRHMFFADERGGVPFADALADRRGPAAILVGPEGGFTDDENTAIRACPAAVPISLGPRILRAETAATAAAAVWMAHAGDW